MKQNGFLLYNNYKLKNIKTMASTTELLNQMENLIKDLENSKKCTCTTKPNLDLQSPVGTTMQILGKKDISVAQRAILLYLVFNTESETRQRDIRDYLDISMKCSRENCEVLMELNYIKRGTKASTWCLV